MQPWACRCMGRSAHRAPGAGQTRSCSYAYAVAAARDDKPELGEDVAHVPGDRLLAQEQVGGDGAVRPAGGDQPQYLELARGQPVRGLDRRPSRQHIDPGQVRARRRAWRTPGRPHRAPSGRRPRRRATGRPSRRRRGRAPPRTAHRATARATRSGGRTRALRPARRPPGARRRCAYAAIAASSVAPSSSAIVASSSAAAARRGNVVRGQRDLDAGGEQSGRATRTAASSTARRMPADGGIDVALGQAEQRQPGLGVPPELARLAVAAPRRCSNSPWRRCSSASSYSASPAAGMPGLGEPLERAAAPRPPRPPTPRAAA